MSLRSSRLILIPFAMAIVVSARYRIEGLIDLTEVYDKTIWYFFAFQMMIPLGVLLLALIKQAVRKKRDLQHRNLS